MQPWRGGRCSHSSRRPRPALWRDIRRRLNGLLPAERGEGHRRRVHPVVMRPEREHLQLVEVGRVPLAAYQLDVAELGGCRYRVGPDFLVAGLAEAVERVTEVRP